MSACSKHGSRNTSRDSCPVYAPIADTALKKQERSAQSVALRQVMRRGSTYEWETACEEPSDL